MKGPSLLIGTAILVAVKSQATDKLNSNQMVVVTPASASALGISYSNIFDQLSKTHNVSYGSPILVKLNVEAPAQEKLPEKVVERKVEAPALPQVKAPPKAKKKDVAGAETKKPRTRKAASVAKADETSAKPKRTRKKPTAKAQASAVAASPAVVPPQPQPAVTKEVAAENKAAAKSVIEGPIVTLPLEKVVNEPDHSAFAKSK